MTSPAILFLIFNRPNKTRTVFESIRKAQPSRLFVAADGPRSDKSGEADLCEETRQTVLDLIDWPCEVNTLFREKNLGCKLAVSSAITWFFNQVEDGIILEDDCLPDPTFFRFCSELLEKYRNSEQIMMISGDNFQPCKRGEASYYFSRYVHIWGWATWRRAWKHYDLSMTKWPVVQEDHALYKGMPRGLIRRTKKKFEASFREQTSAWSFQWVFSCWAHQGLSIMPTVNLVTNIDSGGTHMKVYDPCTHLPTEPISFPLTHPSKITPNRQADQYAQNYLFLRSWPQTILLILFFLANTAKEKPTQLPKAILTIFNDLIAEAKGRIKR